MRSHLECRPQPLSNASIRTVGPELILGTPLRRDRVQRDPGDDSSATSSSLGWPTRPANSRRSTTCTATRARPSLFRTVSTCFLDRLNERVFRASPADQLTSTPAGSSRPDQCRLLRHDQPVLRGGRRGRPAADRLLQGRQVSRARRSCSVCWSVKGGYPIGYDIFEGNTFEGKDADPRYWNVSPSSTTSVNPVVVADAAMLSNDNLIRWNGWSYPFIVAARIRNESQTMQETILARCNGPQKRSARRDRARILGVG
jgi:hypothetical protein